MMLAKILFLTFVCFSGVGADKPGLRGERNQTLASFIAFLSERLDAPPGIIPDPTCKKGVASPDLKACCTDECGSCGDHKLCDDAGAYNEKTGLLVDNCCKARIMKKAVSCEENHPPCVLSPSYKKSLETYKFERPKRHAMDDCGTAPEIARLKHSLGIEKGEFLSKLYLSGRTKYEDALEIAVKVDHLCKAKIEEIGEAEAPLKAKIAGASESDKKVDPFTGISQVSKWKDDLEMQENEARFYEMIIKNAKDVAGSAKKGLDNVAALKKEVADKQDISDYQMKLNELVDDATKVFGDAELLWQQWLDSSKDYDCGMPPQVEHAKSQCTDGNTKFSFKCPIVCQTGYDGKGTKNSLRCLKQGKFGKQLYGEWLGMGSCVGRNCGHPGDIDKAKTVKQDVRFPNFATYNCHEGFSVDGNAKSAKAFTVQCGSAGNYEQTPAHQCLPVKCGGAPPLKNTAKVAGVFYFTDVVTYKCLEGHTIDESPGGPSGFSISCQASGEFSSTQQCRRVRCGPPPDFTNTKDPSDKKDRYYGDEVGFTCKSGFSLDHDVMGPMDFTLVCGSHGEFKVKGVKDGEGLMPKCKPVSAGMSPKIDHGNLPSREMFFGQEAWVSADTGYSYLEDPKAGLSFLLRVTPEGKYEGVPDGIKPFLPVSCGKPPTIEKAVEDFKSEKAVYGDVLPYKCEDGYSTDATPVESKLVFNIQCEADADFSKVPDQGKCVNIDDCAEHTCGPFGECEDLLLDYKCNCDRGFEQIVDEESKEKVCGNINDCGPEACGVGKCIDKIESYDCECPDGYEEVGEGDEKTCTEKPCGLPPSVGHAATVPPEAQHEKQFYKAQITYQCAYGTSLDAQPGGKNHQTLDCQANTEFTKHEDCKPVKCEDAPDVEKATQSPKKTTFNKTIEYKCDKGYTIDGTNEGDGHFSVTCQANGKYTDTKKCKPVSCGVPDEVPNAFREDGQGYFPEKRTYSCFEGFTLDGNAKSKKSFDIECQADGKFTKMQQCLAVVCGEAPKHIKALYATAANEGPVSYPQVSEVTCRDGYTVGGDPKGSQAFGVQCLANGKFDEYDKRECMPVRCGKVPSMPNATLLKDSLDTCECYKCGQSSPHNFGSGTCAPRSPQCSSANAEVSGCYTKAKVSCDCASGKVTSPVGDDLNFEETATFECRPGFTAGGEFDAKTKFITECLANGELSSPPPDMQCRNVDACDKHTCGARGKCVDVVGESITAYECNCEFGFEVQVVNGEKKCGNIDDCGGITCGPGECKDMVGGYTCICPDGHYIGTENGEKTCLPVQCEPEVPKLDNGKMMSKHAGPILFPLSLRFRCDEGYSTDGSVADAKMEFHANCKPDGSFYGMMTCRKISCGTPRVLTYTKVVSPGPQSTVDFQEKAKYKCMEGTAIGGIAAGEKEFEVECQSNGHLTDPKVCDLIACGTAAPAKHARAAISGDVFYSEHLEYMCDKGWTRNKQRDGETMFSQNCLKTGKFSDLAEPIDEMCKPVEAGAVPVIEGAKLTEYNGESADGRDPEAVAVYPDGVEFHCLEGYTLTGGDNGATKFTSRVNWQGYWYPPLPEACLRITYQGVGLLKNARNGGGLADAKMSIVAEGHTIESSGSYRGFAVLHGVPPGTYDVKFQKSGYITVDRTVEFKSNINVGSNLDVSMSPNLAIDQWRAVLKWGGEPYDLDTYAKWGSSKVCWYRRNQRGGNMGGVLEKDDTDGYGPETLFLSRVGKCTGSSPACDIKYEINDYDRTGKMFEKGAQVTLYTHTRIAGTWKIEDCKNTVSADGNWWTVFIIDGRTNKLKWTCLEPPLPVVQVGIREEAFYFRQDKYLPILNGRTPNMQRIVARINYPTTGGRWSGFSQQDHFAVRWEGSIRITAAGSYTFYLTSDDGSKMWMDADTIVDNNGLHGMREKSGSLTLTSDLHAIRVDHFENGGHAGCIFKYKGPDSGNAKKVVQYALRGQPVREGLSEEVFYFGQGSKLANLNGREPNMAREIDTVNYGKTSEKFDGFAHGDDFTVRWTGFVKISIAGKYEFFISSDDGSKLWIDDKMVVDNDGLHGCKTKSGSVNSLKTGYHRLKMQMFERGGAACAKLEYQGADSGNNKVVIPKAALLKAAGEPPVRDENAGLREEIFYFNKELRRMPILNNYRPNKVNKVDYVNYPSTGGKWDGFSQGNRFAVRWTGTLRIRQTGTYKFELESDDGSFLWMGDQPLIDNDGLHGMKKKQGSKNCGTATAIRIDFFENGGGAGCKFRYNGPQTSSKWQIVPAHAMVATSQLDGILQETFYFSQSSKLPNLEGKHVNAVRLETKSISQEHNKFRGVPEKKENFAQRYTGFIIISNKGDYTFSLRSDDGSKLWIDNKEVVNNDGLHGMKTVEGKVSGMIEGQHSLRVEFFQKGGGAGLEFKYKGADTDGQMKTVENVVRGWVGEPEVIAPNAGLTLEAYWKRTNKLYDLNLFGRKVDLTMKVANINQGGTSNAWPGFGGRKDDFLVRWTGSVVVKKGVSKFCLTSDDGSKMYVEDKKIIDNDGLHGMRERCSSKSYSPGKYAIRVDMFERGGGAGCILKYQGDDTNGQKIVVPQKALRDSTEGYPYKKWRAGYYYFNQDKNLPDLSWGRRKPNTFKLISNIDFGTTSGNHPGMSRKNDFAARFTARWYIKKGSTGKYEFKLNSDDGSKLWIDGSQVIDNNGLHGRRDRTGSKTLSEGSHVFRVEWFERGGASGCSLHVKGGAVGGSWKLLGAGIEGFGNPAGANILGQFIQTSDDNATNATLALPKMPAFSVASKPPAVSSNFTKTDKHDEQKEPTAAKKLLLSMKKLF